MQADYYYDQFDNYDGRYNKHGGGCMIILWVYLISFMSAEIYWVNWYEFNCCYDTNKGEVGNCLHGKEGNGVINVSREYKVLCAWGLVLVFASMITKVIAKKQSHQFRNRGHASKCIVLMLFLEFVIWCCWLAAVTITTGRTAGRQCAANLTFNPDGHYHEWELMRSMMWVLYIVLSLIALGVICACMKAKKKQPMMMNAGYGY